MTSCDLLQLDLPQNPYSCNRGGGNSYSGHTLPAPIEVEGIVTVVTPLQLQ